MKSVYLGIDNKVWKERFKEELLEYFGDKTEIKAESSDRFIFKIPFAQQYFARVLYDYTTVKIGTEDKISSVDMSTELIFDKTNTRTTFNLLILTESSISIVQGDSSDSYGGHSLYTIADTDKGLIFYSCCDKPSSITISTSKHIESDEDLTPLTFGNQYVNDEHEVLKQPLKFTDSKGIIYTCKDIFNISYRPEDYTFLPKTFISKPGCSNKTNPGEKFMTSILIYEKEQ